MFSFGAGGFNSDAALIYFVYHKHVLSHVNNNVVFSSAVSFWGKCHFSVCFDLAVYCKNALCRKETFTQLAGLLMKEDVPLTQKRVSVYLLSVLITNNSKINALQLT